MLTFFIWLFLIAQSLIQLNQGLNRTKTQADQNMVTETERASSAQSTRLFVVDNGCQGNNDSLKTSRVKAASLQACL